MRVIAITPSFKHDFLAATIIEGLYELGIEVIASDWGNGVKYACSDRDIVRYSKDADYVFLFSSKKVDPAPKYHLVEQIYFENDIPLVYIDGSEWTYNYHFDTPNQLIDSLSDPSRRRGNPWINQDMMDTCDYYFKREAYPEDKDVYPLPFGVVSKNIHKMEREKTIDVLCSFGQINTGMRASVQYLCEQYKSRGHNVVVGTFPYKEYIQKIKESHIVVDAWGSGDCNARFYEIVANGTCVMHQKPNILIPEPFEDGVHCIEFSNEKEFCDKLDFYLSNIDKVDKIGIAGQKHALKHHTAKARVEYMLEVMNEQK